MPGSWDAESPSATKTHGDHERDIEVRKGTAQHYLKESRHSREIFNPNSTRRKRSPRRSLQPYRKDLTPEEVRQDYNALIEQIQDWVQKLINPWLEDCGDDAHAFFTHVKKRILDADRFKRILREYPDLMNGLNFSEPDKTIVRSVILRYLNVRVFQSVLYDAILRSVQTISSIENHMRASVEPKRGI
ncbi:hypothetical protein FNAPI_4184 [Fusarium napiforme]|uniref:Uncharacterized protein n=1 Tax=Fusarium napiforme TaxID=42672 RepID=A0A8H5MHV0_9HYPO|nr:hypothetical protein FNAPI_13895 [Fusarium napiforme]KAF5560413.1 hypothetical protein FNAPI_4184 [Fusarium napiforme]